MGVTGEGPVRTKACRITSRMGAATPLLTERIDMSLTDEKPEPQPISEAQYLLRPIIDEAQLKLRYDVLWPEFSIAELISEVRYKVKRAGLTKDGMPDSAYDDLLDAVNLAAMAAENMKQGRK